MRMQTLMGPRYNDPAVKPWKSSGWTPPGYANRGDVKAMADDKADGQQTLVEQSSQDGHREKPVHKETA